MVIYKLILVLCTLLGYQSQLVLASITVIVSLDGGVHTLLMKDWAAQDEEALYQSSHHALHFLLRRRTNLMWIVWRPLDRE